MLSVVKYRLYTGKEGTPHAPSPIESNDEDIYKEPRAIKYIWKIHVKNTHVMNERSQGCNAIACPRCCEKCLTCQKICKLTLTFNYLSFGPQITQMCESKTLCHALLEVWRPCQEWLHKSVNYKPLSVSQFWHGQKMSELQDLWNPNVEFIANILLLFNMFCISGISKKMCGIVKKMKWCFTKISKQVLMRNYYWTTFSFI